MNSGKIFDIQRFCWQDGSGIRTVVFFKGCPLKCIWCHNPESKSSVSDMFFDSEKCTVCGRCIKACPNNCHIIKNGEHIFRRENCVKCFECVNVCPSNALEVCGKDMTADDIVKAVSKDIQFYRQSGGGVTLSGGEPLMQYDFATELLSKLKKSGISTAIETSGYTDNSIEAINRYCDKWLFDIKLLSESDHFKYTGVSNGKILEKLFCLDSLGAEITLRCPIIPNINLTEEHFIGLADLAARLKNISEIQLEPYHPLGIAKTVKLGKVPEYNNTEFLDESSILSFTDILKSKTDVKVTVM